MFCQLKRSVLLAGFLALSFSTLAQVTAPDFSVVVLPDTQYYSESYPAIFAGQTQWIVNNAANYNIQFVLGEGDIVNVADQPAQWQNADAAIRLLDNANIPYVLPLGNHDYDGYNPGARGTTAYNTYFGPSRYAPYSWYMGGYPSGTNDNFYAEFTVNGQPYLILALEFVPRDGALAWAKTVLDANPDKEIIVVTHSFTFTDATRGDQCNNNDIFVPGNNQGEAIWQKLLINYPNLSLVLNGHFIGTGSRRADLGLHQNLVNEIFANYQNLTNGGDGWMRILTFRPLLNRIDVVTYSPYLNQYKTDSSSQFSITWHSTGVGTSNGTITGIVRAQRISGSPYSCDPITGASLTAGGETIASDSIGSFSLSLPADNYNLSATDPGWVENDDDEEAAFPTYTSNAKVFLEPLVGNLAGTVTNSSGSPISGATIALSGGTIPTQLSVATGTTGSYAPPPISVGSYTVTASAPGMTTSTASTTIAEGATTTLNIQLSAPTGGTCTIGTVNRTVTICSPANNATVTSPVSFVAQATDSAAVADMQIYIDRVKQYQVGGSAVNTALPLAVGTHRITVLAQDSAGTFQSTINATVSSSTGTGGGCAGTVNRTVTICSPANSASVTSPVSIVAQANDSAAVTDTQIYIDGVRQYQIPGSSVNTSLSLTAGAHRVVVLAVDGTGTFQSTVNVTVSSGGGTGGGCSAPTSPGVQICQPLSGATVSSPVAIQAAANVTGTFARMEVWIDGVKKYSESGSTTLNTNLALAVGTHRFAVIAYNTAGNKWEQAYNAIVQ